MDNLLFAFMGAPGKLEIQALNLARSIRAFAGGLSNSPIWTLVPGSTGVLSRTGQAEFKELGVRLLPFQIDQDDLNFPFGAKVFASAHAESLAVAKTEFLVWMDSDSIVIREPGEMHLDPGKNLGYRPVDHTLIGSIYEEPVDSFWEMIYRDCDVDQERIFPMVASVDQKVIRPYFNAGMLIVRPEKGLLGAWRDNFQRLYRAPHYEDFYQQNVLYQIFIHQTVLAGTVLSKMGKEKLQELPYLVNYPLHMHGDYPPDRQPGTLNQVISCRFDMFFDNADWRGAITRGPTRYQASASLGRSLETE